MSYFRGIFGAGNEEDRESGEEVVEKLVLRLESGDSIDDRRDALKALRSMAKSCRLSVATLGMNYYIDILAKEADEKELVSLTLEILTECISFDEDAEEHDELSSQLAAMLLNKKEFCHAIFNLVGFPDFLTRRNVVQLMTVLIRNCHKEMQDAVIASPMAVSKIVELLLDKREVIRNSSVLLLTELARGDTALQKLLAYENTFQYIFEIIEDETADSIVVEDCLFVIINLLKRNPSNQEFFREASFIARLTELARMFLIPPDESAFDPNHGEWHEQKVANFIFILQIARSLVAPGDNSHNAIHAAQKVLMQAGMVDILSRVLLNDLGVGPDVLSESIVSVSEMIRGNYTNQEFFVRSSLSEDRTHRSALLVLLMALTADKQHFRVRCAVYYCFACFLYDNTKGKTLTIESLLPSDDPPDQIFDFGHHIVLAILANESVQVWFGSSILMHCLIDADPLKSQLLRVQLSTGDDQEPSSLLTHISKQLISLGSRKLQVRCGLLMLLATWMHNCSPAIDDFLASDDIVHFLTTEMMDDHCSYDISEGESQLVRGLIAFLLAVCIQSWQPENPQAKTVFTQLLDRRVGKERIADALDGLTRSEYYIHAALRPQPLAKHPQDLKLEFQFTKLVKTLEADLIKHLRPHGENQANAASDAVVASYKKLIKQQDDTIASLTQQVKMAQLVTSNGTVTAIPGRNPAQDAEIAALKAQLDAANQKCVQLSDAFVQVKHFQDTSERLYAETEKLKEWLQQWRNFELNKLDEPHKAYGAQVLAECQNYEQQLAQGYDAYNKQVAVNSKLVQDLEAAQQEIQALRYQLQNNSSSQA
uniref:Uso1_p115_head domain-containing protein n=1 Tax=Panagrellus redivivus TaxID=6233 RepID=A0A7E4VNW2_PANRE